MRWEELSSPAINALSRDTVVVVPVGAIEQHSLHLPVCTDTAIVTGLAGRLDKACGGRLLVTPTFWLGCSRHHADFPGTLTTELDHWQACVFDIVASVLRAGFRRVFVVNGHGGNSALLVTTLEKVRYAFPESKVIGCSYWHPAAAAIDRMRKSGRGGMGHACELETSLMLAFCPNLVDMNKADKDGLQVGSRFGRIDLVEGPSIIFHRTFDQFTRHGGMGDPTLASAEHGERFIEGIVATLKEVVEDLEADKFNV